MKTLRFFNSIVKVHYEPTVNSHVWTVLTLNKQKNNFGTCLLIPLHSFKTSFYFHKWGSMEHITNEAENNSKYLSIMEDGEMKNDFFDKLLMTRHDKM